MPFSPQTTEIRLNNLEEQKTMTKAQHTPGPWTAIGNDIIAKEHGWAGMIVAQAKAHDLKSNTHDTLRMEANARLIAAAPELLEALKRWHEFAVNNSYTDEDFKTGSIGWISETAAAIAKATGE